jgi:hypothetical protein
MGHLGHVACHSSLNYFVVVYDNDFVWGGPEIERTMVTQEMEEFLDRFRPLGG